MSTKSSLSGHNLMCVAHKRPKLHHAYPLTHSRLAKDDLNLLILVVHLEPIPGTLDKRQDNLPTCLFFFLCYGCRVINIIILLVHTF